MRPKHEAYLQMLVVATCRASVPKSMKRRPDCVSRMRSVE
jgi:hypothetical protein